MVSRENEFRLLFLTHTLSDASGNPPICPNVPFGMIDVRDTSLGLRVHYSCGHGVRYRSWEWRCADGERGVILGFRMDAKCIEDLLPLCRPLHHLNYWDHWNWTEKNGTNDSRSCQRGILSRAYISVKGFETGREIET